MNEENQEVNLENIAQSLGQNQASSPVQATPEPTMQNTGVPKIEDIFSDTEVEKPEALQPKQAGDVVSDEELLEQKSTSKKKLITLIVVSVLFLAIVAGAYFGYTYYVKGGNKLPFLNGEKAGDTGSVENVPEETAVDTTVNQAPVNNENQVISGAENNEPENVPVMNNGVLDTDGDGISDQDEVVRGMDIENPDTDSDGLFDREEVMVYNTDPTLADTDGDGFSDGDEVKGGYNPNGTGKLYDINQTN